jgi:uncharacterized metal-binding protein
MSSLWRSGRSGAARIAVERATISSRVMLSGGCQALCVRAMLMRASWFQAYASDTNL